jgi:hypothetical protein
LKYASLGGSFSSVINLSTLLITTTMGSLSCVA